MFAGGVANIVGQEMAKERDKLAENIESMEKSLVKARAARSDTTENDWANTYRQWEHYEDTEELEAKIEKAKAALGKLKSRIDNHDGKDKDTTCGHGKSCRGGCRRNKAAEREVWLMGTAKRLEEMTSLKQEGNTLYTEKKYEEALALYEKALLLFEYCFDGSDEERERADTLRLHSLLNAASCFLQLKLYPRCVEYCSEALEVDSQSTKAWFRRAKAHRLEDEFDAAEKDLSRAMASVGSEMGLREDIQCEMKLVQDAKRQYNDGSAKLARTMMG